MAENKKEAKTAKPQAKQKEPIRVLDLMCGEGRVHLPVALRYKDRLVSYVGVDWNKRRDSPRVVLPKATAWIRRRGQKSIAEVPSNAWVRFYREDLDTKNPGKFNEALKKISNGEKFDEIHFHLPNPPLGFSHHLLIESRKANLDAIAFFLKPGGRLFHFFDRYSPIMPAELNPNVGIEYVLPPDAVMLSDHVAKINHHIAGSGLKLGSYAMLIPPHITDNPKLWKSSKTQKSVDLQWLATLHSRYAKQATHFVVLRKPR